MRIRHRGKGSKMQQHHVHWVTNTTMSRWMQNTAKAPSLSPPHGTVWNGKGCCLSLQRWFRFFQPEEWASIKQSLITVLFICSFMLGWFLMRCRNLTNKCQHRRISDSHPLIQFEVRHRAFFSIWRKLASATALSSFMVRKIRCQTHLSQGPHSPPQPPPAHLHLSLLTGHVLIVTAWFGVHLGLLSSAILIWIQSTLLST